METNKHKKLQKSRSSQACIREGYRFYMSHFRRIFRVTWLIAIVFAVITAATSAMPVIISPDLLIHAIAIETVAVVLLLYIVGKRLRKRGVMEQTGPLKLQSWLRHLGMILIVTIVCIFVISADSSHRNSRSNTYGTEQHSGQNKSTAGTDNDAAEYMK
jgi:multisubunit Na+/H+ antiporter MnhB subunit